MTDHRDDPLKTLDSEAVPPPLLKARVRQSLRARGLLRRKGTPYDELGLDDPKWSGDQLIGFMVEHPVLIERPIVVTPKGVRLCRPPERVLEILG